MGDLRDQEETVTKEGEVSLARLVHVACVCTRPAPIARCGYVGTLRRDYISGPRCVVCVDLAERPCERCGPKEAEG